MHNTKHPVVNEDRQGVTLPRRQEWEITLLPKHRHTFCHGGKKQQQQTTLIVKCDDELTDNDVNYVQDRGQQAAVINESNDNSDSENNSK